MAHSSINSLAELFLDQAERNPQVGAFQFPRGNEMERLTWRDTRERVLTLGAGLLANGLKRGECVGILSNTRMEWILADLAILCTGAVTTTIYPANTAEECAFILSDSQACILFVEDETQLQKIADRRDSLPHLRKVICMEGGDKSDDWAIPFETFDAEARQYQSQHPNAVLDCAHSISADELATLIYTSGTTGTPKGVELTHAGWLAAAESIDRLKLLSPDDHQYLWLPLSHSFGKALIAVQLRIGFETTVDGRVPRLVENLARIRPTFMAAAPRIFEKLHNRIVSTATNSNWLQRGIFRWSVRTGRRVSALRQAGRRPGWLLALCYRAADFLVFARLRAFFGGRVRLFVSGSAPLSKEIAEFFHAAGILILEGYGLTESSAASCMNEPSDLKFGTVGKPLHGVSVRLAEADGELLLRGVTIMRGYHNRPDDTRATLSSDGWLHTGDIAEIDDRGRVSITDRKKDLIKTSGGKYVAPQKLESQLKAQCPYLSQVVVHGNNRNFCSALVSLDADAIAQWSEKRGLAGLSYTELSAHPEVRAMLQEAIDALNARLAGYETIKKFGVLPRDLSVESGELTPSLKVKRKVVEQNYAELLDSFYRGSIAPV